MVGFLWVGLALDFPALENAMVGFTTKHVVGYEVSVLLGSNTRDEIVDKVFRTELVFSILLAVLVMDEQPLWETWIGATMIVVSGCYIFLNERHKIINRTSDKSKA